MEIKVHQGQAYDMLGYVKTSFVSVRVHVMKNGLMIVMFCYLCERKGILILVRAFTKHVWCLVLFNLSL